MFAGDHRSGHSRRHSKAKLTISGSRFITFNPIASSSPFARWRLRFFLGRHSCRFAMVGTVLPIHLIPNFVVLAFADRRPLRLAKAVTHSDPLASSTATVSRRWLPSSTSNARRSSPHTLRRLRNAKYPTDAVLTLREAAVASLLPDAGWNLVYVDKRFGIFARPGLALSFRDDSAKDFQGEFP